MICVVAIETVVSALNVALHHIAVFPSVGACHDCHSCGIRFANDSSSHSSCRWIHRPGIFPSVYVWFHSLDSCSFSKCWWHARHCAAFLSIVTRDWLMFYAFCQCGWIPLGSDARFCPTVISVTLEIMCPQWVVQSTFHSVLLEWTYTGVPEVCNEWRRCQWFPLHFGYISVSSIAARENAHAARCVLSISPILGWGSLRPLQVGIMNWKFVSPRRLHAVVYGWRVAHD